MDDPVSNIRADLCRRIHAIDWRASPARIAAQVDVIRSLANRHGIGAAATVAQMLTGALSQGQHGALIHAWLDVLTDAAGCERQDRQASDTFAAACAVRFAA